MVLIDALAAAPLSSAVGCPLLTGLPGPRLGGAPSPDSTKVRRRLEVETPNCRGMFLPSSSGVQTSVSGWIRGCWEELPPPCELSLKRKKVQPLHWPDTGGCGGTCPRYQLSCWTLFSQPWTPDHHMTETRCASRSSVRTGQLRRTGWKSRLRKERWILTTQPPPMVIHKSSFAACGGWLNSGASHGLGLNVKSALKALRRGIAKDPSVQPLAAVSNAASAGSSTFASTWIGLSSVSLRHPFSMACAFTAFLSEFIWCATQATKAVIPKVVANCSISERWQHFNTVPRATTAVRAATFIFEATKAPPDPSKCSSFSEAPSTSPINL